VLYLKVNSSVEDSGHAASSGVVHQNSVQQ